MQHHQATRTQQLLGQEDVLLQATVRVVAIHESEIDFTSIRQQLLAHMRRMRVIDDLKADIGLHLLFDARPMREQFMQADIDDECLLALPVITQELRLALNRPASRPQ